MMAVIYVWITTIQEGYLQPPVYKIDTLEDWKNDKPAIQTALADTAKPRHVVVYSDKTPFTQGKDYLRYIDNEFKTKIDKDQSGERILIKFGDLPAKDVQTVGLELAEMMNSKEAIKGFRAYSYEEEGATPKDAGLFLPTESASVTAATAAPVAPVAANESKKKKKK